MDTVRIVLIVSNIVFLILSITFIALYATKHDSSSAFLLSTKSGVQNHATADSVKDIIQNGFSVGSIHLEQTTNADLVLFSVRGTQKLADVQGVFGGTAFSDAKVTDGADIVGICETMHATVPVTAATPPTVTPKPTAPSAQYCNGVLKRDIVFLVDTLASPTGDDKVSALTQMGKDLANSIPFESGTRVNVITLNGAQKLGDFATDVNSFNALWAKLMNQSFTATGTSINMVPAYGAVTSLLTQNVPMEAVIITDHPAQAVASSSDIRLQGVFVAAIIPTQVTLFGIDKLTNVKKTYNAWGIMAIANPMQILACQFTYGAAPTQAATRFDMTGLAASTDTPKCQKLDIIVVFDTSQSVVEPFVRKYADFSIDFISQYTLTGAVDGDNIRTGIISFNTDVTVVRNMAERSLDDFKTAVNSIHYTGGTTNTLAAMRAGLDMFQQSGSTTHGRTMVFLSDGQPYPLNDDTWSSIITVGNALKALGVDIFFVGDDNGYDAPTIKILSNITGNPQWVFNTTSDAKIGLTADLLTEYPCPELVCEMAYYAVEISEILSDSSKVTSLQFILQAATNVYNAKNSTQFQLMIYNDKQYFLPNDGNYNFDNFKSFMDKLIQDEAYRQSFTSGHTRIDTAINAITTQMNIQQSRRPFFQSSILFAGQANSGVLDPINNEAAQIADLRAAAQNIQQSCSLIYALDDSSGNTAVYGDDLWYLVVPAARTVRLMSSTDLEKDLEGTDYYQKVQALDCKLPEQARCDYNFIDLTVAFDVQGQLSANITDYVNTLLSRFNTIYTAHVSMIAYGAGKQAGLLSPLGAYKDMSSGFKNLQKWKDGSFFATTTTAAPSTPAPSTTTTTVASTKGPSTKGPTGGVTIHPATTTKEADTATSKKVFQESAAVNTPITSADIDSLFTLVQSQFGCRSYSDAVDRVLVPNVVFVVSDNFASYGNVWNRFQSDAKADWECSDCPGSPAYVFLSTTGDVPPAAIGMTYSLTVDDYALAGSMKAVNFFNSIVTGLCNMPLADCCSFTVADSCLYKTNEFWKRS